MAASLLLLFVARPGLLTLFLEIESSAESLPGNDPQKQERVTPLRRSSDSVRVAVAQIAIENGRLSNGATTVDLLTPWIKRAASNQADLLVFPEYLLGNFHFGDALTQQLCGVARRSCINVVVGGWEYLPGEEIRHPPLPGTYANTVLVIDRQGKVAGFHRKMHSAVGGDSPYFWPPEPGELGKTR